MKRTWTKPVVALAALSLVVAACGGDDDDAGSDEPAESTADESTADAGTAEEPADAGTAEEPADAGTADAGSGESLLEGAIPCEGQHEGKSVSVFSPVRNSEEDPTVVEEFVAGYDPLVECTGVEIVWQGTDQFETEINVRLQGGDPPDVIDYPQPGLMANHVDSGFLTALPEDLAASTANDFISGWDSYATFDGTVYGIPGRSNVKSLVWYSPSAFAEAGYEVPTTLEELKALSDQIVADGGIPWGVGAESGVATGWVLTDWMEDFMLRTNGEEVYDQWVAHEIPFNDPQVVAVADAVGEFVKNPDYLGGDNMVKAIATTKFQSGGTCIATGDCWLHRQASFYSGLFPEGTDVSPEGDVWYFYLPSPEGGPNYLLGAGDIYAAATDKPETMDVLRYTGSPDYQLYMVNTRGELSPHLSIDVEAIEDPLVKGLSELQLGADVFRFDASDLMPGAVGAGTFWTEITAWVIGSTDTQTMLDNIEASWPS
jgi:alpha-glucoside transport system substrate-binding protein